MLIVKWAADQPLWRQEALRRVLSRGYSTTDVDAVAYLAVATANGADTSGISPLTIKDFETAVLDDIGFHLIALRNVENVNRLAKDQTLQFGPTGITAIYGDNGSGKSGYARVFKRACGARDQEVILANVFESPPDTLAKAAFDIGGLSTHQSVQWINDGSPAVDPLNSIPVFDSRAAPFYVEKSADLAFIPYGLDCFERMAALLDAVAAKINQRISEIDVACREPLLGNELDETAEAEFVGLLQLDDAQLSLHLKWNEEHEAALLSASQAAMNPQGHVAALNTTAESISLFLAELKKEHELVSDSAIDLIAKSASDLRSARIAAAASADEIFAREPLPGIGSDSWRMLFEAAREFATTACPGREFPPHAEGDRCVFCLQELDAEARQRLGSFSEFVHGTLSARAASLSANFKELSLANAQRRIAFGQLALDPSARTHASAEATELDEIHASISRRMDAMAALFRDEGPQELPTYEFDEGKFVEKAEKLKAAAALLQKRIDSGESTKFAEESAKLRVRKAFCHSPAPVRRRRDLLAERGKLALAVSSCGTAAVTKRGGELLKQFVTDELSSRFASERASLHITNIEVSLSATSKKGGVERKLGLGKQSIRATPPQILSEGEYRAVSLAAFFAEQSMISRSTPMVIDDPVSSLDHRRREEVARRIAREAKRRQVIVFTHDLPFFLMLEAACVAADVAWHRVYLERAQGGYGAISDQAAPWDAQSFGERKNSLSKRLSDLKRHHKDVGEDETYRNLVTIFYDRLRKTWERGLEELVFRNTIVRYRPSLQTLRLKGVTFDHDMYAAFTSGMTNASKITGHDQTYELGGSWPDPDTAEELLNELIAFEKLAKERAQLTEKSR